MGDYAQARSYYEQTLKAQECSGAVREIAYPPAGGCGTRTRPWACATGGG